MSGAGWVLPNRNLSVTRLPFINSNNNNGNGNNSKPPALMLWLVKTAEVISHFALEIRARLRLLGGAAMGVPPPPVVAALPAAPAALNVAPDAPVALAV
jgi:hypothetical protein